MVLPQPIPSNWSRTFNVWVQDIQVQFQPRVVCRGLKRGLLGHVRPTVRWTASLVALLFSLHCTRPGMRLVPRVAPSPEVFAKDLAFDAPKPVEQGQASWYGSEMDGFAWLPTASGEPCNPEAMTCAHRTLPFGSLLEVENLDNGRTAVLRVNDRGPFQPGRLIDVTARGARALGFFLQGTARVAIRPVESMTRPRPIGVRLAPMEATQVADSLAKLDLESVRAAAEQRVWTPGEGRGWLRLRAASSGPGGAPDAPIERPRHKETSYVRETYHPFES